MPNTSQFAQKLFGAGDADSDLISPNVPAMPRKKGGSKSDPDADGDVDVKKKKKVKVSFSFKKKSK